MTKRTLTIQDLCLIGVITSVLVIMAQISIPMPIGVPMTMQTFAVMLAGILLGLAKELWQLSFICHSVPSVCRFSLI